MMSQDRSAPNRVLRRRRWWPVLIPAVVALIVADRNGWLLVRQVDDVGAYHGRTVNVVSVVSGDVIEIEAPDALNGAPRTLVRLWGVRAPQPPRPGREAKTMWEQAIAHVASRVLGQPVVLKLEPQRTRDPQGVLLAHVELPEGGTLGESLLQVGLAQRDERWPHTMLTAFAQAENIARRRGEGLWNEQ